MPRKLCQHHLRADRCKDCRKAKGLGPRADKKCKHQKEPSKCDDCRKAKGLGPFAKKKCKHQKEPSTCQVCLDAKPLDEEDRAWMAWHATAEVQEKQSVIDAQIAEHALEVAAQKVLLLLTGWLAGWLAGLLAGCRPVTTPTDVSPLPIRQN